MAFTAAGGTGNTSWTARGHVPDGLVVHESGTLSGVPTLSGTFEFTIAASDRIYPTNTATMPLTLTIAPPRDIVLYASDATKISGAWFVTADAMAAGGKRLWNPDAGAAKLTAALPSPVNYFELLFSAEAGVPYHLWIRGKADKNKWANDSIYVQFSGSVDAKHSPITRIGSTSGVAVSLEAGTNAGLSEWGWADNAYGGFGDPIYFASTGPQTIRVQVREDGVSLDQIVLSADRYLMIAPGATKNDTTILLR